MQKPLNQTWDLESIFPGGSESPQFAAFLEQLSVEIAALEPQVTALTPNSSTSEWHAVIEELQKLVTKQHQASAFISCLTAQNTQDQQAKLLSGKVRQIGAALSTLMTNFDDLLNKYPDLLWEDFINQPQFTELRFVINERRERAKTKLCAHRESLATDLAVDGYHAWSDLYYTIVGRMNIAVDLHDSTKTVSIGQANNMLTDPDRNVRQQVFEKYEAAFAQEAELLSSCLNHIAGFRLNLYRHRQWDDVLMEPLEINRMSRDTLEVMWDTITKNKPKVAQFLQRKAELLGLEKLAWYDVDAPISSAQAQMSYDDGAEFIVANFAKFDPQMADFARHALENRWVEAEDRPYKRAGGFCTSFPVQGESRIFMTYSGSLSNISTLAHELGHAYHQHVMQGLAPFNKHYAMNVAETASTFAELLVADAAIKHAANAEERLLLLEDKIQRSIAFFMNIHARFLFETRFYALRKERMIAVKELNALMEQAQKETYLDSLSIYHPYFWASKLHFYITGTPFYNFPYTFGYLFSSGIYSRALAEGPEFAGKYRELLRDTGRMRVEDLARKHLGVDLTKPDFWQSAIDLALADIDLFLQLTEKDAR